MKHEQVIANVELRHGDKLLKLKVLIDTGVSKSITPKRLVDGFEALIHLREPMSLE